MMNTSKAIVVFITIVVLQACKHPVPIKNLVHADIADFRGIGSLALLA